MRVHSITIACVAILGLFLFACGDSPSTQCLSCHKDLKPTSSSHSECVSCHRGDPNARDKETAHRGMYKNPSSPDHWEKTCGDCHTHQLARVRSGLMFTNTGMIRGIQETWEGFPIRLYATKEAQAFSPEGNSVRLHGVSELDSLGGELYRKFCSRCHLARAEYGKYRGSHASGCAACHFPYNKNATYQGKDPTVHGEWPYSADHRLEPVPGNKVCLHCHNRSGRIAQSYMGLYDGNNGLVPTQEGNPGPFMMSGGRSLTSIKAGAHFQAGMDCVDCHTSRDIMGDGYAYSDKADQVEIACSDCHGNATARPEGERISRESSPPVRESKNYPRRMRPGRKMVLTSKGRKYSNVFYANNTVHVLGKKSGELYEAPVITGSKEHSIEGHERLKCFTCHTRSVPQCYGCHTEYDRTERATDYIKGRNTRGRFSEREDFRRLFPFPLAVDSQGEITTVTPGCQTFVSIIDSQGKTLKDEYVARYKGKRQLRFAPLYSHNVGSEPISCEECHRNPSFVGFGQSVLKKGEIVPTLLCEKKPSKPLDGFLEMKNGEVGAFSAIVGEGARPLNATEVKDFLAVNQCLICHHDPKDPIYQQELDYDMLPQCLARPRTDPYGGNSTGSAGGGASQQGRGR